MRCGIENAGDATQLDLDMIYKALPHRLITNGTIAGNGFAATVADKDYLAIFLQIECHRAVFASDDVNPVGFLSTIFCIICKHKATN